MAGPPGFGTREPPGSADPSNKYLGYMIHEEMQRALKNDKHIGSSLLIIVQHLRVKA